MHFTETSGSYRTTLFGELPIGAMFGITPLFDKEEVRVKIGKSEFLNLHSRTLGTLGKDWVIVEFKPTAIHGDFVRTDAKL